MKLVLIGATGGVGSFLLREAIDRGHDVTAIARHPHTLAPTAHLHPAPGDLADPAAIANLLRGHDAAISAVPFVWFPPESLLEAVRRSGVPRLVVVGGAGSLEVAPGRRLVDTPQFPEEYREEALAGARLLERLRAEPELDWTFISPSAYLFSGTRTGHFRLGRDQLLVNERGDSEITIQDYAIAMLDEIERPQHRRLRFTVGY